MTHVHAFVKQEFSATLACKCGARRLIDCAGKLHEWIARFEVEQEHPECPSCQHEIRVELPGPAAYHVGPMLDTEAQIKPGVRYVKCAGCSALVPRTWTDVLKHTYDEHAMRAAMEQTSPLFEALSR